MVHTVKTALAAFNAQNNGTYFKLVEISRAQNVVKKRINTLLVDLGNLAAVRECVRVINRRKENIGQKAWQGF